MIYLPKELPELRDYLATWVAGPQGWKLIGPDLAEELEQIDDGVDDAAKAFALVEGETLQEAPPFHISPTMVQLLLQARHGVGEAGFMDYDIPTPTGMAYFATDIDTELDCDPAQWDKINAEAVKRGLEPVRFEAEHRALAELSFPEHLLCVWRVIPPKQPEHPMGAVLLSWWFERDSWLTAWDRKSAAIGLPSFTAQWGSKPLPRFVPDGHQIIGFHPESSSVRVDFKGSDATYRGRRPDMFRALCYLLRQRVAEESTVMPDRAARRRYAREGKEPPPVRVISIRGGSAHGGGDGSREYVHRWVVRGHWRRQWYRSIQAHRPIWITPYVKGPEDAPLLGGEKVYSVAP